MTSTGRRHEFRRKVRASRLPRTARSAVLDGGYVTVPRGSQVVARNALFEVADASIGRRRAAMAKPARYGTSYPGSTASTVDTSRTQDGVADAAPDLRPHRRFLTAAKIMLRRMDHGLQADLERFSEITPRRRRRLLGMDAMQATPHILSCPPDAEPPASAPVRRPPELAQRRGAGCVRPSRRCRARPPRRRPGRGS